MEVAKGREQEMIVVTMNGMEYVEEFSFFLRLNQPRNHLKIRGVHHDFF